MLEKPAIDNNTLIHCLNDGYGKFLSISFLPIGADMNTAVYKAVASDNTPYFVKLRRGTLSEAAVLVPAFLAENGMKQVIPAFKTQSGSLYYKPHNLDDTWLISLYPFVKGHHGYQQKMSPTQWGEFGAALKHLHTVSFPTQISQNIAREDFSSRWHDELRIFLAHIKQENFVDPVAAELAALLTNKRKEILKLIKKLEESSKSLLCKVPEFVLCHADIHCWNLLIDDHTEDLYIVDWDTLIFAPKERDLMFIGVGLADSGYTAAQEIEMFSRGYGQTAIDHNAINYYRCRRIIEDLVVYCQQIFLSREGGENRRQSLEYTRSIFRPNGVITMALG